MWSRASTVAICALSWALAPGLAMARDTGFYLGGGAGYSFIENDDELDLEDRVADFDIDDEDFAWKGYAGFQFLPWLALEAGYVDFGDVEGDTPDFDVESKLDGWDAFLVGNLPLGFIDVFAKVGVIAWDLDLDIDDDLPESDVSTDGENLAYGVGAGFELGRVTLRAEAEGFDVDDLYMLSVGASLDF